MSKSWPGKKARGTAFLAYVKAPMENKIDMFKEPQEDPCAKRGRKIVKSSGDVYLKVVHRRARSKAVH